MKKAITITFGNRGENHIHNQSIGSDIENGLDYNILKEIEINMKNKGANVELLCLNDLIKDVENFDEIEKAYILIIRKGVDYLLNEDDDENNKKTDYNMYMEHNRLEPDKHFWNIKRKEVSNKLARWNLCFDEKSQIADYENKKGTIVAFDDIVLTKKIKTKLEDMIGINKYGKLVAEGNYYYQPDKCGIGWHGDGERKIVIAVRLGVSIPLYYHWYYKSKRVGDKLKLNLNSGDIYFMSEKAVGTDWKKRNIYTLRHAAGCDKYTK